MVIPWLAAYGGGEQEKEMGLVGPHWAWLVGISGNFDLIRVTRTCFVFELVIGQDHGDPPGSCRARTHPIQPLRSTLPGRDPQQRPLCPSVTGSQFPHPAPVPWTLHCIHHTTRSAVRAEDESNFIAMGAVVTAVIAIAAVVLGWITIEMACKPCLETGRRAMDRALDPNHDPDSPTNAAGASANEPLLADLSASTAPPAKAI